MVPETLGRNKAKRKAEAERRRKEEEREEGSVLQPVCGTGSISEKQAL
jgi:hypothetical protein